MAVITRPVLLLNTDHCVLVSSAWASFCSTDTGNISIEHLASFFHLRKLKASAELTNVYFFKYRTLLQLSICLKFITNQCAEAAKDYGLTIRLKKAEIMCHPTLGRG